LALSQPVSTGSHPVTAPSSASNSGTPTTNSQAGSGAGTNASSTNTRPEKKTRPALPSVKLIVDFGGGINSLGRTESEYASAKNLVKVVNPIGPAFFFSPGVVFVDRFSVSAEVGYFERGSEYRGVTNVTTAIDTVRHTPFLVRLEWDTAPFDTPWRLGFSLAAGINALHLERRNLASLPNNETVTLMDFNRVDPVLRPGLSLMTQINPNAAFVLSYAHVFLFSQIFETYPLLTLSLRVLFNFDPPKK